MFRGTTNQMKAEDGTRRGRRPKQQESLKENHPNAVSLPNGGRQSYGVVALDVLLRNARGCVSRMGGGSLEIPR